MPLMIRNPLAAELARKLADRRGTTMSDAVVDALRNELKRDDEKRPLRERILKIAEDLQRESGGKGRKVTKEEIDSWWGHDDVS